MKNLSRFVGMAILITFFISLVSPFLNLTVANANPPSPMPFPEQKPFPEPMPIPDSKPIPDRKPSPPQKPPVNPTPNNSAQNGGNQGSGSSQSPNKGPLDPWWKWFKFTVKSLTLDYVKFKTRDWARVRDAQFEAKTGYEKTGTFPTSRSEMWREIHKKRDWNFYYEYGSRVIRSGIGVILPTNPDGSPTMVHTGLDVWSGIDNVRDFRDHLKNYIELRRASGEIKGGAVLAQEGAELLGPGSKVLRWANPVFSGVGTIFAVGDFVNNYGKGDTWGAVASAGDILMNAAPLVGIGAAAVFGVAAAPVTAAVFAVGLGVWAFGTIAKNRHNIARAASFLWNAYKRTPSGRVVAAAGSLVKKAASHAVKTAKRAWEAVTGWFGS